MSLGGFLRCLCSLMWQIKFLQVRDSSSKQHEPSGLSVYVLQCWGGWLKSLCVWFRPEISWALEWAAGRWERSHLVLIRNSVFARRQVALHGRKHLSERPDQRWFILFCRSERLLYVRPSQGIQDLFGQEFLESKNVDWLFGAGWAGRSLTWKSSFVGLVTFWYFLVLFTLCLIFMLVLALGSV